MGGDGGPNSFVERVDVLLDELGDPVTFAGSQSLEDVAVFDHGVAHVGDVGQVQVPEPVALGVEHVEGVEQETVGRRLPHDLVAAPVDGEKIRWSEPLQC